MAYRIEVTTPTHTIAIQARSIVKALNNLSIHSPDFALCVANIRLRMKADPTAIRTKHTINNLSVTIIRLEGR